ncbi:MAG: dihydrodipicolinate synthase family protein [Candidatus Binatia bacterium]|jgi:dihydrodipicolinate synthase/N-acetylneuraminate lyase
MKRFEGIFTVMVTAYTADGGIDRAAMAEMAGHLIEGGVHGLVVLGSNGECPYLAYSLQRTAIDVVVQAAARQVPVIVGINERGTEPALEMARYAQAAGAHGLLVALPLFYPLELDAVHKHYQTICSAVDLPVLFYNFPSHSHLYLTPEQIASLAKIGNLVGAKETILDINEVQGLVEATDDDFSVFTGMCLNLTQAMQVGACGAICPLPNIMPQKAVQLYEALALGDMEAAAPLQNAFNVIAAFTVGSPTPQALIKEALRLLGHPIRADVKPPLPQLTTVQAELARSTLAAAGLLDAC